MGCVNARWAPGVRSPYKEKLDKFTADCVTEFSIEVEEEMKIVILFASLGVAAICPQAASAHHSYASFDMSKSVKLTGVVKEFHWTNPHSFIVLSTTDSTGQAIEATLETNGPGYLARQGWKRESIQTGDKITVTVHPMHDGTPGGSLMAVTLPSGKELSAEVTGPRPVEAASPAGEKKNDK